MNSDSRKTTAILCAAGALIAAAVLIERSPAAGGSSAGPAPVPGPTPTSTPTPDSCGAPVGAASRVVAGLSRGHATGALSAGTIQRGGGGEIFASFELAADQVTPAGARPPLNIALVIDRSGSMANEQKLEHAQQAALGLIGRLGAADRIALIQYDDSVELVVPSVLADGEGKARLRAAVRALRPGGATNLHGGMIAGRDEVLRTMSAGQVSRVILLSDGKANAGESNPSAIGDAARLAADRGAHVTSVGVGLDYNEDLMEAIAESGRGHYYYVRDPAGLDQVLAGELSSVQATVATQVELRLRPACAGGEIDRVFGYESRRDGGDLVVPLADLYGGDTRRLVVRLRIPDRAAGTAGALVAELRYRDAATGEARTAELPLAVQVSDDQRAAERSVDADVMAQVLTVQAAETMRSAARAYEQGDAAGAAALLRSSREKMVKEGGRYRVAPAALAPTLGEMSDFAAQAVANRPGSTEGNALLKQRKSEARKLSKGK